MEKWLLIITTCVYRLQAEASLLSTTVTQVELSSRELCELVLGSHKESFQCDIGLRFVVRGHYTKIL